ncbi:MAG: L,D-transpeptidase family protein [Flavobacteriales bacterium]|nr:L,D-transpeptidase family protein [Flavobacteriales bacterium]
MEGRCWSDGAYRFGFNGKENDDEIKGEGNFVAYELRIYDSRLGRWFSTDPREREYAWQSTYSYFNNSPIAIVDYLGGGGPEENYNKHKGEGGNLYLPKNAIINDYNTGGPNSTLNTNVKISTIEGSVRSFNIGQDRFVAFYNGDGTFNAYKNSKTGKDYQSPEYLMYDGQNINRLNLDNLILESWPATSGSFDYQKASDQSKKSYGYDDPGGPVPEGTYTINLKPDPNGRSAGKDLAGNLVPSTGGGLEYTDHGNYYAGWGVWRARLDRISGNSYNRDNHYIHDSGKGETHGCVETTNSNDIYYYLWRYRNSTYEGRIFVIVKYSNPNASTFNHLTKQR